MINLNNSKNLDWLENHEFQRFTLLADSEQLEEKRVIGELYAFDRMFEVLEILARSERKIIVKVLGNHTDVASYQKKKDKVTYFPIIHSQNVLEVSGDYALNLYPDYVSQKVLLFKTEVK